MKKILLILAALALWQNWDKLERWLEPAQAGNAGGEVVLYATSWCGYCAKTRELFAADGIAYREVDIEKDSAGKAKYQALGGRGVPLIDMRGRIIHGYDQRAIRAAY
ncbi:glutaredoxin family protein [Pseudomonas sp. NPDC077186]|uniref:glutaredoxin family protein n=1 Tax=Pseudomonas sp. NPDC077186 TaxID=3364421 RepID=UPI0037CA5C43